MSRRRGRARALHREMRIDVMLEKKNRHTSCPVHHIRRALIRPEEKHLWLPVQVDNLLLDTRAMARCQQIDDRL